MLAELGFGILTITFTLSLYAVGASVFGYYRKSNKAVESARRAQLAAFPFLTIDILLLIYLLYTNHFEIEYVYSVTDITMPGYLKITALWGGQPGSLLFWSWLLSICAFIVTLQDCKKNRILLPWIVVVVSITLAFFLALIIFFENPFQRWWQTSSGEFVSQMFPPPGGQLVYPGNGEGLNPLLRHPGMILHPPMLYIGFVAFIIPYAFAIAKLITGHFDNQWTEEIRKWTLAAWLFLSLGLVLGMRWAYDVLGWGGYWGWDPVEIAALMPWLTGTPFLHSMIIEQKRGMLKAWNLILIILTYSLVLFGTFLTRSGILSSVHAFAESAIGPMFFSFIGIMLVFSTALLINQWKNLPTEMTLKSLISRESLFLVNNLLFLGILIVCLWGVLFPLISELVTGVKITVGPPFYERAAAPILGALMALMGIAPLSAWGTTTLRNLGKAIWKPLIPTLAVPMILIVFRMDNWVGIVGFTLIAFVIFISMHEFLRGVELRKKATNENYIDSLIQLLSRNQRRYGGYIIHIGMVTMAIGILGIEIFQTSTQKSLSIGESLSLGKYSIQYDSLSQFTLVDGRIITRAEISLYENGDYLEDLYPRYEVYPDGQPVTIAAVRSTLNDDIYIVLVNWDDYSSDKTAFKVYRNPLIVWLWIGSIIFIFGYLVIVWPHKQ